MYYALIALANDVALRVLGFLIIHFNLNSRQIMLNRCLCDYD